MNLSDSRTAGHQSEGTTTPLARLSAAEAVFNAIRGDIESGRVAVGAKLSSEAALAQQYGVSRSVVREALRSCNALGLTVTRTGKGTFVVANQVANDLVLGQFSARDLTEARPHIEIPAAGLAAERRSAEDLDTLRSMVASMAVESDPEAWVTLDSSFHAAIARASGNKVFESVVADIRDALTHQSETLNMVTDRQLASDHEHQRILQAIEAGNAADARAAMSEHLHAVGVALDSILSEYPAPSHPTSAQSPPQGFHVFPCLSRKRPHRELGRLPRHVPLAAQTRGGLVESIHYGSLIATAGEASGTHTLLSAGDPLAPFYPRSALKPLQAVAMVRAGLDLPADLLALTAASHSGAAMHRDGAARILQIHGLTAADLENSTDLPYGVSEREEWLRGGGVPTQLTQNCSGKHASMAATCVINGWPVRGYLDPAHPLQQLVAGTVRELTGEDPSRTTTDGCGTPLFALTLRGMARAFGTPGRCANDRRRRHSRKSGSRRRASHAPASGDGGRGRTGRHRTDAPGARPAGQGRLRRRAAGGTAGRPRRRA